MNNREPLFACEHSCDIAHPADELRIHNGKLICSYCWDEDYLWSETGIEYSDLPPFVPESERKIKTLTEGLECIKRHMELSKAGALSNVWHIADATLKKAESIGK